MQRNDGKYFDLLIGLSDKETLALNKKLGSFLKKSKPVSIEGAHELFSKKEIVTMRYVYEKYGHPNDQRGKFILLLGDLEAQEDALILRGVVLEDMVRKIQKMTDTEFEQFVISELE